MNIIEKYDKPFQYGTIILNLIMAYQFYMLWSQPELSDASKISSFVGLMIFEFIMVHSGLFMAFMPKRISLFVFVPFYGVFALIFNSFIESQIILIVYLIAVFNRMRFAFSEVSEELKGQVTIRSVFAMFIYFVLIFVVLIFQSLIPYLGLTPSFLKNSAYFANLTSSGVFVESPHIAICFGVIYYMALTCMGYYLLPVYVENGDEVVVNPYKKIEERMAKLKNKKRYRN